MDAPLPVDATVDAAMDVEQPDETDKQSEPEVESDEHTSTGGEDDEDASMEESDDEEEEEEEEIVDAMFTIGVCAMDKKARSKPMKEILSRLPRRLFRVVIFGNDTILNAPVEEWPQCDALIAFFSTGFPLEKALEYVKVRNPVVVNDLDKQHLLMDRRDVYRILEANSIPTPRHVFMNRESYMGQPPSEMVEAEDYVEVNGVRITKPFVEKPVDAEDHNIHIYYPMNAGGGCKKLFRKVGNRSSEFDPSINTVRKTGSYIYEEFLSTQGTDVKVYTVGPNYAHAEARKSPVLDGRVMRDSDGKEIRYPVILSTKEKEIAYNVCQAFGQTICGFDILRVHDASYVCDVNGWSFVKNSEKYYDDCATLVGKYLERSLQGSVSDPFSLAAFDSSSFRLEGGVAELSDPTMWEHEQSQQNRDYQDEELRCVLAVIRHGDRTPKQKMKMLVCHPSFLQYYEEKVVNSKKKDLKIKAVADLEQLLVVSKDLIRLYDLRDPDFLTFLNEREQTYGEDPNDRMKGYRTLRDVLQRWQLNGINRKVQLKPKEYTKEEGPNGEAIKRPSKLMLILKWGGDLTHTGEEQAERLGQHFRQKMYPGGDGGLIRLHSTYRHDLKIYTSDEGRVQKTAASFAKGLLELEGDLIPILVGLVLKSKDADSMLDQSGSEAQEIIMRVKQRLHHIIHRGDNCAELMDSSSRLIRSVAKALTTVDQPIKKMEIMHKLLGKLKDQLTKTIQEKAQVKAELTKKKSRQEQDPLTRVTRQSNNGSGPLERSRSASATRSRYGLRPGGHVHAYTSDEQKASRFSNQLPEEESLYPEPCGRETLDMMRERWAKLYRDFYLKKTDTYDLSKLPDIHDCIRYDAIHNSHLHLTNIRELLDIAASLAHTLVPQEYGINENEKIHIGSAMCRTLLMKIKDDLDLARGLRIGSTHRLNPSYAKNKHEIKSTHRSVRTRLYFTSESHLHTLLNVLRYGRDDCPVNAPVGEEAKKWVEEVPELCYMTHFVVRVFERFQYAADDPQRFRLEISFSPGADQDPLNEDVHSHLSVAPLKVISREGLTCQELVDYFADVIGYAERNNTSNQESNGHSSSSDSLKAVGPESSGNGEPLKRSGYLTSDASTSGDEPVAFV
ncbi:hypothetical protein Poli38472_012457 [Pythium oligandrum]|uniref:Inositol hexakisphosphate and diphosphoinositol-pentakisphosphate kinase n=1 Tax=Pythium oligandrum TaxID=41045 RepID=A0A8K1CPC5_PYTOL|nr:hypothetical protein Poli38472_012457 [Pythium oligandrum]|eukprot:TMW67341.1 hypothetical protein Poli38472_012457 [Pythium oligandrum]